MAELGCSDDAWFKLISASLVFLSRVERISVGRNWRNRLDSLPENSEKGGNGGTSHAHK